MKDKRFIASLEPFALPPARKAAVLQNILAAADETGCLAAPRTEGRPAYSGDTRLAGKSAARESAAKRGKRRARRALRVLAPVAALLIVCAALFAVPGVSRAVQSFFASFFRVEEYLSVPPDERSPNPDYEGVITTPAPAAQSFSIAYLDETEHLAGVNDYRAKAGFAPFARADYAWIAEIVPALSEVLYDGRNFYMTTRINVSPLKFAGVYGAEGEGVERMDMSMWDVSISCGGQSYPYAFGSSGTLLDAYYDADARCYDVEAMRKAGYTYLMTELSMNESPALPSGTVDIVLSYAIYDGRIDDMATVGMVAIVTQRFSFDTSAANASEARATLPAQTLAGVYPVTVAYADTPEPGSRTYQNVPLDFSKLSVTPVLVRRATELEVELHYARPAEWDEAAFLAVTRDRLSRKNGLQYELLLDGQSLGMAELAYAGGEGVSVIVPLTQTERAGAHSLSLRPVWGYASHIIFEADAPVSLETPYVLAPRGTTSYDWAVTDVTVTLEGCDIVIPLS